MLGEAEYERLLTDSEAARSLVEAGRRHRHDDLLMQKVGLDSYGSMARVREIGVMLIPSEARSLLVAYFAEHPPAISGELYIAPEWYEDAVDYLPVWGAREFLVDGREAFGRWDNLAIFIDKRTGEVREDWHTPNFGKIKAMTPIAVPE